jgi:hypothetical protein
MGKVQKKAISAYLDHLLLTCLDPGHEDHRARFVYEAPKKTEQERHFHFPAMNPDEALDQLKAWVQVLLTRDHAMLLPIEAVIEHWSDGTLTPESILAWVELQLDQEERCSFSTVNGPVPEPTRYKPPPEPMVIMRARLGDYLDIVCGPSNVESD